MLLGLAATAEVVQRTGEVIMDVGVAGVIAQGPLEGRRRQFPLAQLRQHTPQVRPRFDHVLVQFDGHIVAFSRGGPIAQPVEEFGQLEADFRGRSGGGQGGAIHFRRRGQLPCFFQLGCQAAHLLGGGQMGFGRGGQRRDFVGQERLARG